MEIGAATTTATAGSKSRVGLADNFDSFLLLLTTQLQNQDPTSPMDADQFTQQLVQFSSVEQQIKSNETLTELAALIRGEQLTQSVGYLGAEVEAAGDIVRLGDDGIAKIHYNLDQRADLAVVRITDERGKLVASFTGETEPGRHSLSWDGIGADGIRRTDGSFKVEILAQTATGSPVGASTTISGIVDGVELDGDRTLLSIDGLLMPLNLITAVRRPTPVV